MQRYVTILALLALAGCGDDSTEEPADPETTRVDSTQAPTDTSGSGPTPASRMGGTVVVAGQYVVEVIGHGDGQVEATVRRDSGEAPTPTGVQLTVHLTTTEGGRHPVVLTWDPGAERFRGRLHHAHPIPGPVTVSVVYDGHTSFGHANSLVVTAPPEEQARVARGSAQGDDAPEPEAETVVEEPAAPTPVRTVPAVQLAPATANIRRPPVLLRPNVGGPGAPTLRPANPLTPQAPQGSSNVVPNRRARATDQPVRARSGEPGQATVRVRQ